MKGCALVSDENRKARMTRSATDTCCFASEYSSGVLSLDTTCLVSNGRSRAFSLPVMRLTRLASLIRGSLLAR